MSRKVILQTKLKHGEIVRTGSIFLGVVVQHETFLNNPGYYAFNNSPGDRKFIKETGVDWYKRYHIKDLVRMGAEVITRNELLSIYRKKPNNELKNLVEITKLHMYSQ